MNRSLLPLRLLSLFGLLAAFQRPALAHDVPQRFFDRAVEVGLESEQLHITYRLSLSQLTLAEDLLSLVGAGGLSGAGPEDRLRLYGERMGPLIARGLVLRIDGVLYDVSFVQSTHVVEDHPRFEFDLAVQYVGARDQPHRLAFEDTSFFLEKGQIRIAIRAESPWQLESSTVPSRIDELAIRSAWEMTPEQQVEARRAEATWRFVEDGAEVKTGEPVGVPNGVVAAAPAEFGRTADHTRDLTDLLDRWPDRFFFSLLGMAFFFGAAHAMTPGHGKTMVAAYLVGERGTIRHAIGLGLTTSLTHTSSVLVIALLLWMVGPAMQDRLSVGFSLFSGILVAALGGGLLIARLRSRVPRQVCVHGNSQVDGAACSQSGWRLTGGAAPTPGWFGLITLGVSGGIVPCPDAIVLLLIATAQGQVERAVYLLLSFSAGLASALVLVGVLAVKLRGFLGSRLGNGRVIQTLPVISAAAILAVGLYLCVATLQQPAGSSGVIPATATRTAGP